MAPKKSEPITAQAEQVVETQAEVMPPQAKLPAKPRRNGPVVENLPATTSPMGMISQAIQQGASIEVIERLVALQERWDLRQSRIDFDDAMAAAKGEIPVIAKTKHVGFASKKEGAAKTDYWHEDLASIAEVVDPVLSKYGIRYHFETSAKVNEPVIVTCFVSRKGYVGAQATLDAPRDVTGNKNAVQQIASTVTYLQRYTLKAALGLAAGEDDDGQAAGNGNGNGTKQAPVPSPSAPAPAQQPAPKPVPAPATTTSGRNAPHAIVFSGLSYAEAAQKFLAQVAGVIDPDEADQWIRMNLAPLRRIEKGGTKAFSEMLDAAPMMFSKIYTDLAVAQEAAEVEAKKPAPVPPPPAAEQQVIWDETSERAPGPGDDGPVPGEAMDPATGQLCPDYDKKPDDFLEWVADRMREQTTREGLKALWDRHVEHAKLMPPDRSFLAGVMKVQARKLQE